MLRIACLLLVASAGDKTVTTPFDHLKLKPLEEGTRGLRDAFPYLAVGDMQVRPETLPQVLESEIDSETAAIEALRLFAAGPVVRDAASAQRVIDTGTKLQKQLKHLRLRLHDYRPAAYAPSAKRTKDGWTASLVAFEMDRRLRLVHLQAHIDAKGAMKITRKPIVDGPMTTWQVDFGAGGPNEAQLKEQLAMRREVLFARKAYATALRPRCTVGNAWAIARLRFLPPQLDDLWGPHDRVVGSGLYLVARDLDEGGAIVYDATSKQHPVYRVRWVKSAEGPMRVGKELGSFARR
ncbi:MAG: hypothetical protein AAGD14_09975 [Planctomycetota bacterium]